MTCFSHDKAHIIMVNVPCKFCDNVREYKEGIHINV